MSLDGWNDEAEIIARLVLAERELRSWDRGRVLDHQVPYYPDTWLPRLVAWPSSQTAIDRSDHERRGRRVGVLSRGDLLSYALRALDEDAESLIDLFVVAQVWGSGTTNGRGPRYTASALDDAKTAVKVLRGVVRAMSRGDIETAYSAHLPGWGPAFVTKYMYAIALALPDEQPRSLILDSRVWDGLNDRLRWSSLIATGGDESWPARYSTYVEAMHRWAGKLHVRADAIELLLFDPSISPTFKASTSSA